MKAAVAPSVFLLLVAYFVWNALQGDRGLRERDTRAAELAAARQTLSRAQAELAMWERRVAALRGNHIDQDALDERARAMLNLSDPGDIVVNYPPNQKLF
jgi:cell division protein FtsB